MSGESDAIPKTSDSQKRKGKQSELDRWQIKEPASDPPRSVTSQGKSRTRSRHMEDDERIHYSRHETMQALQGPALCKHSADKTPFEAFNGYGQA